MFIRIAMSTESGEASWGPKASENHTSDSPSGVPSHRITKKDKGRWKHSLINFIVCYLFVINEIY